MAGFIKKLVKFQNRRGNGELVGFAIAMPMLMLVFCALIMAAQLGLARQTLEYSLYSAARAAVVQGDFVSAQNAAEMMADAEIYTGTMGVTGYTIELEVIGGTFNPGSGGIRWEKGALLKVVLTMDVDTISPFRDSTLSSEIIMMVERPASGLAP
jgi:Flp pilus assembly protein TadG